MHSVGGRREQYRDGTIDAGPLDVVDHASMDVRSSFAKMPAVYSSMQMDIWKGIKVCCSLSVLLVHQQLQQPVQHSTQRLPHLRSFQILSTTYCLSFITFQDVLSNPARYSCSCLQRLCLCSSRRDTSRVRDDHDDEDKDDEDIVNDVLQVYLQR